MKNMIKNTTTILLALVIIIYCSSCKKDVIAPPNQSIAFVKYYGHVGQQTAMDMVRTSDGGFLLLGATNSYTKGDEKDIFVVRTDSLGNEIWSSSFGKDAEPAEPYYLRYDEEGIRIVEMPDESIYTIACNRTYVTYPNKGSSVATRGETKIVLYQIDASNGAPTTADGVTLVPPASGLPKFTEKVSDMKVDTSSGVIKYVLTGMTTNVPTNKATVSPQGNAKTDLSDIFTVALNENFQITWTAGNQKYGSIGKDYGLSVHILPQGYLVCGTIERNYAGTGSGGGGTTYDAYSDLLAVFMDKGTGQPSNPNYYGREGTNFKGGRSVYNPTTGKITIYGHVDTDGGTTTTNTDKGKLVLKQIDESGAGLTDLKYLDVYNTAGSQSPYISVSIAELPNDEGYVLSATHQELIGTEHDICIIKVNSDLNIPEEWKDHIWFGYDEVQGTGVFATQEVAGTVLPITQNVNGTAQVELTGYAFVGSFGLGTNNMLGLVKLNSEGKLVPE